MGIHLQKEQDIIEVVIETFDEPYQNGHSLLSYKRSYMEITSEQRLAVPMMRQCCFAAKNQLPRLGQSISRTRNEKPTSTKDRKGMLFRDKI